MPIRLKSAWKYIGRLEKLFILLLVVYIGWMFASPDAGILALVAFLLYVVALIELVRLVRWWMRRVLWSLRNRLITAYAFITVVPIVCIAVLAGMIVYVITGGVAAHLVGSELDRRVQGLNRQAQFLVNARPAERADVLHQLVPFWRERYSNFQLLVSDGQDLRYPADTKLLNPPPEWGDAHGVLVRDGRVYLWAHARNGKAKATILAPIDHELLATLVPGLGEVSFLNFATEPPGSRSTVRIKLGQKRIRLEDMLGAQRDRLPPKYNRFDMKVTGMGGLQIADWDRPGETQLAALIVDTRTSAVLRVIFGQSAVEFIGQGLLALIIGTSIFFLFVEIVSLSTGVSITRKITGAVHSLYEGTQRIKEGDFSHRIVVKGNDQLSELAHSFNTMTENLERLFVVEKERERLQSELEIAREVQSQLFPKSVPEVAGLQIAGWCSPARMVSGDYYDFLVLPEGMLAVAIGDVAGKGISAALLMAAIQSTIRTQLSAGIPVAAAVGAGGYPQFSTAHLVAQLNKQLYANTSPEKYATFCFGMFEENSGVLSYTNAGHLPPMLLRNGSPELLQVTGTVVGAFPFARYEEQSVILRSGNLLCAYTDGIVEPENVYGEQFGDQRLSDLLVKHRNADTQEIIARVMESVEDWTGTSELQDDMTMVVIRKL